METCTLGTVEGKTRKGLPIPRGRQGWKVDKGEEKRTIKTHEDLIIYQKAFDAAMTNA